LIFILQIPPLSRNDKTFVLRGYKMGWLRHPILYPPSHRNNVFPSEARNLYALSLFFLGFVQFVMHTNKNNPGCNPGVVISTQTTLNWVELYFLQFSNEGNYTNFCQAYLIANINPPSINKICQSGTYVKE